MLHDIPNKTTPQLLILLSLAFFIFLNVVEHAVIRIQMWKINALLTFR
jgi:hypothetical protein